jgi:hypothetical protein
LMVTLCGGAVLPSVPFAVAVNFVVVVSAGDVQVPCGSAQADPAHPPLSIVSDATFVVLQLSVTEPPELMLFLSAENVRVGVLGAGGGGAGGGGVPGVLGGFPPPLLVPLVCGPPHAVKSRIKKIAVADEKTLRPFAIPNDTPEIFISLAPAARDRGRLIEAQNVHSIGFRAAAEKLAGTMAGDDCTEKAFMMAGPH